jgi:dihydrofolate reductase
MRKLIVIQNMTLDGRIEMLDDWFDPQGSGDVDNSDLVEENRRQDGSADGLLVGRNTFESFRSYWRDLEDDQTGVSDYLNGVHKYVVSSTLAEPDWEPTTIIDGAGDVTGAVAELKQQQGGDIVCTGSIQLTHALIAAGLVDEYRLFVYPVVQGRGKPLFPEGSEQPELALDRTQPFRAGVALLTYKAAA